MRIAMMTNNYKPFVGGVPISIEQLSNGLAEQGHEVTIFAPAYPDADRETENNIHVLRYASISHHFAGCTVLPNSFDPQIEEEFAQNHYDVIHVHHPLLIGRTAIRLSRKYHIPLVFTYHTRYDQYFHSLASIRKLEEDALKHNDPISHLSRMALSGFRETIIPLWLHSFLKHCHQVAAPTIGMKEYLTETCGFDSSRIAILPTGLDDSHFKNHEEAARQIRAQYGAERIPLFLSVSRMAHEKNVAFLLQSAARFKAQYQRPFRLLMAGDGPDRESYELLSQTLGLTEEVKFIGNIENSRIAPYYEAADAFLFASKTETQGIVILEAFAGGTPVIALDASGVRDLVTNGVNGYLCPEDTGTFAQTIHEFLTDQELRKIFSDNARHTAEDFREEAVVRMAIQLYNRVIAQTLKFGEKQKWKIRITF